MILVTGASGRVGSRLVDALVKQGEKVRTLEKKESAPMAGVEAMQGDILDPAAVEKAVDGVDAIYHLAAMVDYYPVPNDIMYKVNVTGTKNMLEHSKARRFVYLSSTSVYGKRMKENPASERTQLNPHSFYGETKAMAEKLVLDKGGVVIRSPPIFGPGFNEGFGYVIAQIEKGKMQIIGDGKNRINWIHINDLIDALLLAKDKGKPGEIYLIAGKEIKTQAELFALLAKHLGVEPPKKGMPRQLATAFAYYKMLYAKAQGKKPKLVPEHINRITDDRNFDISKARSELGFAPKIGYDEAAEEMVEEYLKSKAEKK